MSLINVTNIKVGNNVCSIKLPLIFQIEFECLENLKHDVEWKIIYITSDGSGYTDSNLKSYSEQAEFGADNSENGTPRGDNRGSEELNGQEDYLKSQNEGEIVLDAVCLGPVHKGILEFEFRVNPPNFNRLKPDCILGMQAILITGSYCDQEFIRIGYYTNNTYDEESLRENPPDIPILDKVVRCIIDQPRVTRFPIKWDNDDLVDFEGNRLNFFSDDSKANSDESKPNSDYEKIDDDTTYLTDDSNEDVQLNGDDTTREELEDAVDTGGDDASEGKYEGDGNNTSNDRDSDNSTTDTNSGDHNIDGSRDQHYGTGVDVEKHKMEGPKRVNEECINVEDHATAGEGVKRPRL